METKSSVIAVNKIDKDNIHKYGVIKPGAEDSQKILIDDIVEKPKADEAPSDIAVCGRYIFNSSIFEQLKKVTFDNSGEIQLTDANKSSFGKKKMCLQVCIMVKNLIVVVKKVLFMLPLHSL